MQGTRNFGESGEFVWWQVGVQGTKNFGESIEFVKWYANIWFVEGSSKIFGTQVILL